MTVHYYKYSRNARAAARRVGLDPDVVVQPAPAGFYSVDFGDIEPTEPEPQGGWRAGGGGCSRAAAGRVRAGCRGQARA